MGRGSNRDTEQAAGSGLTALRGRRGAGAQAHSRRLDAQRDQVLAAIAAEQRVTWQTIDALLDPPELKLPARERESRLAALADLCIDRPRWASGGDPALLTDSWPAMTADPVVRDALRAMILDRWPQRGMPAYGTDRLMLTDPAQLRDDLLSGAHASSHATATARQAIARWASGLKPPVDASHFCEMMTASFAVAEADAQDPSVRELRDAVREPLRRDRERAWQRVLDERPLTVGAVVQLLCPGGVRAHGGEAEQRIADLAALIADDPSLALRQTVSSSHSAHVQSWPHMLAVEPSLRDRAAAHIARQLAFVIDDGRLDDLTADDLAKPAEVVDVWTLRHDLMRNDDDGPPDAQVIAARLAAADWVRRQDSAELAEEITAEIDLLTWPLGRDTDAGTIDLLAAVSRPLATVAARSQPMRLAADWAQMTDDDVRDWLADGIAHSHQTQHRRTSLAEGDTSAAVALLLERAVPGQGTIRQRLTAFLGGVSVTTDDLGEPYAGKLKRLRTAGLERVLFEIVRADVAPGDRRAVIDAARLGIAGR